MAEKFKYLAPRYSVPGTGGLYEISGLLGVPKPVVATIMNYLDYKEQPESSKIESTKEILAKIKD